MGTHIDDWLSRLEAATPETLAEIDVEIDKLRQQKVKLVGLRRLLDLAMNGRPARPAKGRTARPAVQKPDNGDARPAAMSDRRKAVARLLGNEGPMAAMVIANRLEIPKGSITSVLQCEWFKATPDGYRLTEVGRREGIGPPSAP